MPSCSSTRVACGPWVVAAYRAALGVLVVALLGLWTSQGLAARDAATRWSLVGASSPAVPAPGDQSPDDGEVPAPLEAEGVNPIHPSLRPSPFENIDLTSGNLALIIPLLHLPGSGLIDLDVTLSLNTKHWRWRIGPGSIAEALVSPRVISADGTSHYLEQIGVAGDDEYLSPEFWRYQRGTHLLQKPNGVTVLYGRCDATTHVCLPLQESDPFGNVISYTYVDGPSGPQLTSIGQPLGDNQMRQVAFTYDAETGTLQTMTYGTATWTFEWADSSNLHRVTLATHGAWVFDRTPAGIQSDHFTVTTPTGGVIQYETIGLVSGFNDDPRSGASHPVIRRYVASRSTIGPQLAVGTWSFQQLAPGEDFVAAGRSMQDPDGTKTTYTVDQYTGLALSRTVVPSGQTDPVETETINRSDVDFGAVGGPLVRAKTTMRDGFTYRTEYAYGPQDPGLWADFGQPRRITTYGDFTRTTAITYRHEFGSRYIRGKVASVTVDPDGPAPVVSSGFYDNWGFMTSKTVEGITTTYARDDWGNLLNVMDGEQKSVGYSHQWGRTSETRTSHYYIRRHFTSTGTIDWVARDYNNGAFTRRTLFEHDDALERETLRTPPAAQPHTGLPTATNYDHEADAVSPSDPDGPYVEVSRGVTWTRAYLDGYGRTRQTVVNPPTANDPPTVTTTDYDALGRKVFQSLPFTDSEVGTSYTYDALGRVKTKTTAGKTTTYSYGRSAEGSTVTITEPFGLGDWRTTIQTWQASGGPDGARLVGVQDAKGDDTTYAYNVIDKLTTVHAPGVLDREYHYIPGTSRLLYEIQPESGRTDYTYYLNGLVHTKTDALGHVVTYDYDDVNRLYHEVTSGDSSYTTDTTYDDPWSDNVLTIANPYASSTFTYDDASRLTSRVDTIHAVTTDPGRTFTTTYEPNGYDQVGSVTYPSGRVVSYGFDDQRRIQSVADGARTYASGMGYHPSGQVTEYTSGNGVSNHFGYDPVTYWPTSVTHGTNGAGT